MKFLRRLAFWLHHDERQRELADEMAFHADEKRREMEANGLSGRDAELAAARALGHSTLMREEARAVWIWPWLESVWQDVAYAARSLRRQPGFTLVATITLASAIGVNTSLFTVFNALLLRSWDVAEPARMVNVFSPYCCEREGGQPNGLSLEEVRYFATHATTMTGFLVERQTGEAPPDEPRTSWVSGNYFTLLGVTMEKGRSFAPDEDRVESPIPVAVVSYRYWQTELGADPDIIGKQVRFEAVPFTIIGVAAKTFTGTHAELPAAWIPTAAVRLMRPRDNWVNAVLMQPAHCCTNVAGRLAPGASLEQAQNELSLLRSRYQPNGADADKKRVVLTHYTPLGSAPPRKRGPEWPTFLLMLAGAGAVLALACANVGNLLLARSFVRRREIAVRLSLGASRARLVRQLLTESMALALLGGGAGLLLAQRIPAWMIEQLTRQNTALHATADWRVVGFTLGLSVLSCLLFGLAPALHATRPPSTGGVRVPLRAVFLSVQVALCIVLLVGAGLLVRGVQHGLQRDLGLDAAGVTEVAVQLPANAFDEAGMRGYTTALAAGLDDASPTFRYALTSHTPLFSSGNVRYRVPGQPEERYASIADVSAEYFGVLQIPIAAGRTFAGADAAAHAVIVNASLARELGGVRGAIGRSMLVNGTPSQIVGVAADAYLTDIDDVEPFVFRPYTGAHLPNILVRTDAPGAVTEASAIAARTDPRARTRVTPLISYLDRRVAGGRLAATTAGALGALALLLASVGIFGVFSFWVQQRTQEIGVRMALGARPAQVIRLVFGASSRAVLAGIVIGIGGAVVGSQALRSLLYGLDPLDPAAFAAAVLVLLLAGGIATWLPARRATRVDPIQALRAE